MPEFRKEDYAFIGSIDGLDKYVLKVYMIDDEGRKIYAIADGPSPDDAVWAAQAWAEDKGYDGAAMTEWEPA